jgi:hypothetical protein
MTQDTNLSFLSLGQFTPSLRPFPDLGKTKSVSFKASSHILFVYEAFLYGFDCGSTGQFVSAGTVTDWISPGIRLRKPCPAYGPVAGLGQTGGEHSLGSVDW